MYTIKCFDWYTSAMHSLLYRFIPIAHDYNTWGIPGRSMGIVVVSWSYTVTIVLIWEHYIRPVTYDCGFTVFITTEQQNRIKYNWTNHQLVQLKIYQYTLLWYFDKLKLIHNHLRIVLANGFVPKNMLKLKLKEHT